jgi:hypothetical protein
MHAKSASPSKELEPETATGPGPETLNDEWLDETLDQSFPASDPVPSFRGDSVSRVAD